MLKLILVGSRVSRPPRSPLALMAWIRAAAISDGFSRVHGTNFRPEKHKTKHKVPSQSSSGSDEQSGPNDQAFQILEQQNRVMEEFVNQQQKNTHPEDRCLSSMGIHSASAPLCVPLRL